MSNNIVTKQINEILMFPLGAPYLCANDAARLDARAVFGRHEMARRLRSRRR